MTFWRFLLCLLIIPAAALAVAAPRYVADPYGVFNPPEGVISGNRPNLRFIKHLKLSQSCRAGEGYVLGTSRATGYDVETLEDIYGFPFFNYTVPTENWAGMEFRARWLMEHCDPGLVVLTLDPLTFRVESYTDDYLRLDPPEMTGRNPLLYRLDYLRTPMSSILRLESSRDDRFQYDADTGHWSIPASEHARAAGRGLDEKGRCGARRLRGDKAPRFRPQIESMEAIKDTARQTGTDLLWAVTPLSSTYQNRFDIEFYRGWALQMLGVTEEFLFLAGYNPFTTDGTAYWEYSHFRYTAAGPFIRESLKHRDTALNGVWTQGAAEDFAAALTANYAAHRARCAKKTKGS